ncbi:MAG TPA: WD40 repeat domain-containing protein [Gemmataceae bacterium]|nr:WD40 repeat domain-containing protein [Gemmataceae bacterium]
MSSRLRQSLVHPDRSGILRGLCYSADGRRIFAGHYRSGVVQAWDAVSGRQLTTIETGPRNSSSSYFLFSADGQFLYVDRSKTSLRLVGKDKRLRHWEFSGGVRSLDMATGKPVRDFSPAPGCGLQSMDLSPNGSTLLTFQFVSGDYESTAKSIGILWDARTGQRRGTLPANASSRAAFSPDSKTILTDAVNDKDEMTAFLFLDAGTGEVLRSIPIEQKHLWAYGHTLSPDGKRITCQVGDRATRQYWLKCWDVESGREIVSFEIEQKFGYVQPIYSPDGRRLLAACYSYQDRKPILIDMAKRKIIQRIAVESGRLWCDSAFSPDGKWLAVISQDVPKNGSAPLMQVENLPQPHILLVEAATGEVRETIVAPPGVAVSLCFSPDGKTLASGGDGRVLLWDMTKLPGAQPNESGK